MDAAEGLRLLATAVAGRPIDVVDGAPGEPPSGDGRTIRVPPDAPSAERRSMVALQAALVAAGSLDPAVVRSLGRRPAVARRYLAVEGHRALGEVASLLPPGARRSVRPELAGRTASATASAERARSSTAVEEPPPWFGTFEARRVLDAASGSTRTGSGGDAGASASSAVTGSSGAPEDDMDDDGVDDALGDLLSSPVGGGGPLGRVLARLLGSARRQDRGGAPGADAPSHAGHARGRGDRRGTVAALPEAIEPGAAAEARTGTEHPEWDVHRRTYRPGWCTVTEVDPPLEPDATSVSERGTALRRPIARLGVGRTPTRRQRQGDDLDLDAVVEARVDQRAGVAPAAGVYVESQRRRRDLAVLVLLDVSGSAGEPGTGGRSVHQHQAAVAAQLLDAAYGLGDRVALYGFRSRGRRAVQLLRVKAFDDPLDGRAGRRLGSLAPAAYTRLGAAIRHGAAILDDRAGTPRRLLVVLSDGFAYDHGYEGRYGEADARRALVEARRQGIGCLCLSVGGDTDPAALRRVFGPAAHATVPRPHELPALLGPLFRAALRSAEAQQQRHQQRARARARRAVAAS